MKRTLLGLVAAVVVLGLVTWLVTQKQAPPPPGSLNYSGYATAEQLQAEKGRSIMDAVSDIAYPVDEILIEREGEKVHLVRSGEGKDLRWSLRAPIEALAVKFQVEKMVKVFKEDTLSVYTKEGVKPEMLALFDLEPARRIGVTLKSQGAPWQGLDLWVGKSEGGDDAPAEPGQEVVKDTWVMVKGDESTVYRVASKDLRQPFEISLSDLRDKKLFGVKAEDIVRVLVTAPDGAELVLEGDRQQTPAAAEGEEPKVETTWRIAEPAGYQADDSAKTLARNIANARTREFVARADAPADALSGALWRIEARTHDGVELGLELADGEADQVWGRVIGQDAERIKVEKFTAKNLRKSLADVRDKTLLPGADGDAVTLVRFAPEGEPSFVVAREGESWRFTGGGPTADPGSHLDTAVTAKATRYARPDELGAADLVLANPEFVAEVHAGSKRWSLAFGPKIEADPDKGNRWAQVTVDSQAGEPVLVQDHVAKRFRKARTDLRWKKLFGMDKGAIQRVELTAPGGASSVALERAPGGDALEVVGAPEGRKTKTSMVTTVVNTLPNLRAKDFVDGKQPADLGLTAATAWTVAIATADGQTARLFVEPAPEEGSAHAVADTGPLAGQVVTLNTYQAKNLQKGLEDFLE